MQKVLVQVGQALGLRGQFEAHVNILLIYEKDGTRSEKADGMFGTLVIALVTILQLPALISPAL
jgi:hypothetical protein